MVGTYDGWLVLLSVIVAITASYVALDLAARVVASQARRAGRYWVTCGAISMGTGIWSMHFVGMLAFNLPISMSYDIPITALSLLIAIMISGFALYLVSRDAFSTRRLFAGGVLMATGIAAMHYIGMAAMRMDPPIRYDQWLFALSILIAFLASLIALWSAFKLRMETIVSAFWKKAGSAFVMGSAIYGMHYTGMAAAIFAPNSISKATSHYIHEAWFAPLLGGFTLLFLLATLLVSAFDAYVAELSKRHAGSLGELNTKLEKHAAELERANVLLKQEVQARARVEEALRQAQAALEERVAERTSELMQSNRSLQQQIAERKLAEQTLRHSEERLRDVIEERERLARDLHDNIVQSIYAIGMKLEQCLRQSPENIAAQLAWVIEELNGLIRDVRQYIKGPEQNSLRSPDLRAELIKLIQAIETAEGPFFEVELNSDAIAALSPDEADQVLHIAREALSNSMRHSHARRGRIAVDFDDDSVRLQISDEGVGFDPRQPKHAGEGLHNMGSRVRKISGKLQIVSALGTGTRIIVKIPKATAS